MDSIRDGQCNCCGGDASPAVRLLAAADLLDKWAGEAERADRYTVTIKPELLRGLAEWMRYASDHGYPGVERAVAVADLLLAGEAS
jgi:hypothetical protein